MRWRRRQLSAEEDFAGSVRAACQRMGLSVHAYDGESVDVRGRRLTGKVALDDLRAQCALLPREQWEPLVVDALQGLALAGEARTGLTGLASLDTATPLLRSRVQAEGAVVAEDVVRRPLCPGLVETLAVDLEGALAAVPRGLADGWGRPDDELLDLGRAHVFEASRPAPVGVDLGVEPAVLGLETTDAFAGSAALQLEALLPVPDEGALVALPTRHLLLAAPLRTRAGTLLAAQALLVNAEQLWRDGPGGLSPDLFWRWQGRLVHLPGSATSLSPPLEFVEVLDRLPDRLPG